MTEQRDEELEAAIGRLVGAGIDSDRGDDIGDEGRYGRASAVLLTLIARKVAEARESALREVLAIAEASVDEWRGEMKNAPGKAAALNCGLIAGTYAGMRDAVNGLLTKPAP